MRKVSNKVLMKSCSIKIKSGEVVVARLAKGSLTIPEDPGSNPVIGNLEHLFLLLNVCRKDENKEKEAQNGPFFLKKEGSTSLSNIAGLE